MSRERSANLALIRQSAIHAGHIRDAIKASVNIPDIVSAWSAAHLPGTTVTTQQGRSWARLNVRVDSSKLAIALKQMYATGYVIGVDYAAVEVGRHGLGKAGNGNGGTTPPAGDWALGLAIPGIITWGGNNRALPKPDAAFSVSFSWDSWKPGHRPAEALVRPPKGLQKIFDREINKQVIIKGIDDTTLDRIGTSLADSLAAGEADTVLADRLSSIVDDPRRALTIAQTEMNRAMSVASMDSYGELGVEKVEWFAIQGCDLCEENAQAGPQDIGIEFPSGDTEPPAHPNCLCDILPYIEGDSTPVRDMGGDVLDESGDSIDLAVSPDRVKGVPGPLEVARALSRLAILPNPNRPELADQDKFVQSPWTVVPLPTVDPNLWDDAKTVVVDLDDLYGTDAILKRKNIKKHIETMGQAVTPYRSYAMIAEVAGKPIIIDGHHRLMATWLLGQESAAVYKIVID